MLIFVLITAKESCKYYFHDAFDITLSKFELANYCIQSRLSNHYTVEAVIFCFSDSLSFLQNVIKKTAEKLAIIFEKENFLYFSF